MGTQPHRCWERWGGRNYLLDPPEYRGAPIDINPHPRRLE